MHKGRDRGRDHPESAEDRLEGWAQIAGYLRVSDRQAKRYREAGLPIYKSPRQKGVWAFRSELDDWKEGREVVLPVSPGESVTEAAPARKYQSSRVLIGLLVLGMVAVGLNQLLRGPKNIASTTLSGEWREISDGWRGDSTGDGRLDTGHLVGPGAELTVDVTPHGPAWSGGIEIFQDETHWTYLNLSPNSQELVIWRYPGGEKATFSSPMIGPGLRTPVRLSIRDDGISIQLGDELLVQLLLAGQDISSGRLVFRTGKHDDEWGSVEPGAASFGDLRILQGGTPSVWSAKSIPREQRADDLVRIFIYNVDDQLDLLIDGQRAGSVGYLETLEVNLTPYLSPGEHEVSVPLFNRQMGLTYGIRMTIGEEVVWDMSCGQAGERNGECKEFGYDQLGLAETFRHTFSVR